MIAGLLVEVVSFKRGSQTVAAYASGATTVTIDDPTDFSDDGGRVDIGGTAYDYTRSGNVLTITPGLTEAIAADTPVSVVVGNVPAVDVYAVVDLGTAGDAVLVPIDFAARVAYTVGPYDPPLPIMVYDDLTGVETLPGATPVVDGAILAPGSLQGDVTLAPGSVSNDLLGVGAVEELNIADDAVTGDKISATAIDGKTITGALFRTAATGARTEISDDGPLGLGRDDVRFHTGHAHEDAPGYVGAQGTGPGTATEMSTFLAAPGNSDVPSAAASLQVTNSNDNGADHEIVWVNAELMSGGGTRIEFLSALIGEGRLIRGVDFGRVNGDTTNGSSQVTVTHDLGATPVTVLVFRGDQKQYVFSSMSSTNFVITARNQDNSAGVGSGQACDFFWLVIR